MEVPDAEVYKTMKDVAAMKPTVARISSFIDNGVLDKRIQKAVTDGVKACPFYIEGKTKKKITAVVRWVLMLCMPILVTILTLFASGVFAE